MRETPAESFRANLVLRFSQCGLRPGERNARHHGMAKGGSCLTVLICIIRDDWVRGSSTAPGTRLFWGVVGIDCAWSNIGYGNKTAGHKGLLVLLEGNYREFLHWHHCHLPGMMVQSRVVLFKLIIDTDWLS